MTMMTAAPRTCQGADATPARRSLLYCGVALLAPVAYQRARTFLEGGRPLEHAVFAYAFEQGPAWRVLDALATFQNPDGGFGHGLEPDHLGAGSSALATTQALRLLVRVAAPASHALVRDVVAWSQRSLDPNARVWPIVATDDEHAPHAPWWDADGLSERFNGFTLNPKAELLAGLYALGAGDDGALDRLAEDVVRELEHRVAAGREVDMHEIQASVALADAPHVPVPLRHRLVELLEPIVLNAVGRDREAWRSYGMRPLTVAPRPGSAFAAALADLVQAELDYLIEEQSPDGAWYPTWAWGRDDDTWTRQRRVWAGVLSVNALTALHAHGRLGR